MARKRQGVINIHSSVPNRQPKPSALEFGEIAINNSANQEFISTKNMLGQIARFSSDKVIMNWVEKKEVFPSSGNVDTLGQTIDLIFNQKVSPNSPNADLVSGTSGASLSIDASALAFIDSDVSFTNATISGNLSFGSMSQSSDKNLKENIVDIDADAIEKIEKVNTHSFNFKDDKDKRKMYGVIAQEVEEAGLGELVHTDAKGNKSVDYTGVLILKLEALEKKYNELLKKLGDK